MNEINLIAVGREFVRLATAAEELYQENKALKARIEELEAKVEKN